MKQLSGQDATFLYWETPDSAMHIGLVSIYGPSELTGQAVDFTTFRTHIRRNLPLSDVFRQKLAPVPFNLDHPYWIQDPDFDLDNHVRHVHLSEPSWNAFCELVAKLHSQPLDRSRPLWEMIYIDGVGGIREDIPPGAFATVTKIHHAAIDGATGAELTAGLHDLAPDAQRKVLVDRWVPDLRPTPYELIRNAVVNNIRVQPQLAKTVIDMLPVIAKTVTSTVATPGKGFGATTRFSGRVSPRRIYEAREYPVATLSEIRKLVPGATVNDAILAVGSGALRHYLDAKGELPNESLTVMAPINVRKPEEKHARGGNAVSLMTLSLCTDIADPLKRLQAIHEKTSSAKAMVNAVGARELTNANESTPAATLALSFRLVTGANLFGRLGAFNTVISNVPGPQVPVYLCGAKMLYWSGLGPATNGVAVGFPILSYNGNVNFGINGCARAVPDPEFLAECFDRSYEELAALI